MDFLCQTTWLQICFTLEIMHHTRVINDPTSPQHMFPVWTSSRASLIIPPNKTQPMITWCSHNYSLLTLCSFRNKEPGFVLVKQKEKKGFPVLHEVSFLDSLPSIMQRKQIKHKCNEDTILFGSYHQEMGLFLYKHSLELPCMAPAPLVSPLIM